MILQIGIKNIHTRLIVNHTSNAVLLVSINFPAIHGIIKALTPKHWEYKAIAEPRYLIGEDFIIESEAEGRNIHRAIVIGMKAITINIYPLSKKFEMDKQINPISNDIKHNSNLSDEFLFLIM